MKNMASLRDKEKEETFYLQTKSKLKTKIALTKVRFSPCSFCFASTGGFFLLQSPQLPKDLPNQEQRLVEHNSVISVFLLVHFSMEHHKFLLLYRKLGPLLQ